MKQKKSANRAILTLVCALVVLITLSVVGFASAVYALSPVAAEADAVTERVEIPSGTSVRSLASRLAQKKLIRSEKAFYLAARYPFVTGRTHPFVLKSGLYAVSSAQGVGDLLEMFESGKGMYITTVIPEGLTLGKIAAQLEEQGVCGADDFKRAATDVALLSAYNIPVGLFNTRDSFEGYLFPDTYFFTPQMTGEAVVRMMADNFFAHAATIPALAGLSPVALHDVVILASIVEREYRVDAEAPLIASVFTNRIKARSGLYSCATIEYVITEIMGHPHPDVITYEDLKIDSPYNTYKWAGLTPGPISNPGMVALQAAAQPPETDYFYFTLTDAAVGSHTFSNSFNAHIQAGVQFKTKKAAASK